MTLSNASGAFFGLFLVGCSPSIYFGTFTRIGIDASTDGAGIGGKTAAMAVAPTKKSGGAFSLLAKSDMDMSYADTVLDETIAIGDAAECVTASSKELSMVSVEARTKGANSPNLIFGSYSSFSLIDLTWGSSLTQGIHFGYKRGAGIRMPVQDDKIGSAYARVTVNTTKDQTAPDAPVSNLNGIRLTHVLATGVAAVQLAKKNAGRLAGDTAEVGCKINDDRAK